jgi:hypothetical protein
MLLYCCCWCIAASGLHRWTELCAAKLPQLLLVSAVNFLHTVLLAAGSACCDVHHILTTQHVVGVADSTTQQPGTIVRNRRTAVTPVGIAACLHCEFWHRLIGCVVNGCSFALTTKHADGLAHTPLRRSPSKLQL